MADVRRSGDLPGVDVKPLGEPTAAEVERWKIEKKAEREFLNTLFVAVRELETKVGKDNRVVKSMNRFMNNQ